MLRIRRPDGAGVDLLHEQQPAGPHGVDHPPKGLQGVGKVLQDAATVDEVVMGYFQVVLENVVPADLEVGHPVPEEEAGVEVGRHDAAFRPDAPSQPAGHGAIAGAHV